MSESTDKKEIISFDPFSSVEDKKEEKKLEKSDDNIRILYITGAIIFSLIILYIIIIIFTKEPNIDILEEMLDSDSQKKPISDNEEF